MECIGMMGRFNLGRPHGIRSKERLQACQRLGELVRIAQPTFQQAELFGLRTHGLSGEF